MCFIIYSYHLDLCKNVFGPGVYPDVDATNLYYGGRRLAGTSTSCVWIFFYLVYRLFKIHFMLCINNPNVSLFLLLLMGICSGSKIIFSNGSQDPWRHASKQTSSAGSKSGTLLLLFLAKKSLFLSMFTILFLVQFWWIKMDYDLHHSKVKGTVNVDAGVTALWVTITSLKSGFVFVLIKNDKI